MVIRRIVIAVIETRPSLVFGCILVLSTSLFSQAFQHPGIFNTREELEYVKAKIKAGVQPYKDAYDDINGRLNLNYQPSPQVTITSQSNSDKWMEDCNQAYNFALVWYYSGEQRYADKAIEILNAWSIFEKGWNDINTDWGSSDLFPAAEIIRYSEAGWNEEDIEKFTAMTTKYLIPMLFAKRQSDNRLTTKIRAAMAIYVFLDDREGFDTQVEEWRRYTPIYVHEDGTCRETCRDQHHVMYGLEGVLQGAQIAWNQGIDLYAEEKSRLVNFLELYSGWSTGDVEIPSDICSDRDTDYDYHPGIAPCRASGTQYHNPPCKTESNLLMDKHYTHYTERFDLALPRTRKYNDKFRPYWDRMALQDYGNLLKLTPVRAPKLRNTQPDVKAWKEADGIHVTLPGEKAGRICIRDIKGSILTGTSTQGNSSVTLSVPRAGSFLILQVEIVGSGRMVSRYFVNY